MKLLQKIIKGKTGSKKRELKLTVSRALSDEIETRARSLASLKRARVKRENKHLQKKKKLQENLKPVKREVNIPETITVQGLSKQNGRTIK